MNESVKVLISLSVSGSLLILLLYLLRFWYKKRFSKRWQYYIWLIVIARLVVPYTPRFNVLDMLLPVKNLIPIQMMKEAQGKQIDSKKSELDLEQSQSPGEEAEHASISKDGVQPQDTTSTAKVQIEEKRDLKSGGILASALQYIWLLWLLVATVMITRKVTIYQSFVKYLRAGWREVEDVNRLDQLAELEESMGIHRNVELYTNPLVSSPLFLGFLKPRIILPNSQVSESEFQYIILHELTHYKRRDLFYKWLVQITMCIHWFNPLVYLVGKEVERMCELSCDEAVIKKLDSKSQYAYGDTLLSMVQVGGNYQDRQASLGLTESKSLLKERLEAILSYQRTSKRKIVGSVVCILLVGLLAAGSPAYASSQETSETSNSSSKQSATVTENPVTSEVDQETTVQPVITQPLNNIAEDSTDSVLQKNKTEDNRESIYRASITEDSESGLFPQNNIEDEEQSQSTQEEVAKEERKLASYAEKESDLSFGQHTYYESPYSITTRWYVKEVFYKAYANKVTLTLSDQSKATVYFSAACKSWSEDQEFMDVLQQLMEERGKGKSQLGESLAKLVILGVTSEDDKSPSELAAEYDEEE